MYLARTTQKIPPLSCFKSSWTLTSMRILLNEGKRLRFSQVAHEADQEYFYSTPPDGMVAHCKVTPTNHHHHQPHPFNFAGTHLTPGWREALWKLGSCLRTQHNVPGQDSNQDHSIRSPRTNHEATAPLPSRLKCNVHLHHLVRACSSLHTVWEPS